MVTSPLVMTSAFGSDRPARVAFVSLDWSNILDPATGYRTPGGAGYYRMTMPATYLARHGVDAVIGQQVMFDAKKEIFATRGLDGEIIEDLDVVVLQRWMDKLAPTAIKLARANGQIVINDVDDFFDGLHPKNGAWAATHPKTNPNSNRNHYRAALAASSGILCSTPFLQKKLQLVNDRVALVRNAIDLERWPQQDVSGDPILGWVGATSHRSDDLQQITHPVSEFLMRYPASSFFHGGAIRNSPAVPKMMGASRYQGQSLEMLSILDYPSFFERFNVGLVPLSDCAFNRSKSFCKGLEYAASGIPFLASPMPEYERLALTHGIGRVVRKPKHWRPMLEALRDEDYRVEVGAEYRESVQAFDMELHWQDWLKAITEISAVEKSG